MKRIVALFGFLLAIHCLIGQPGSQTPASASDSSSKRVKILNADILKYQRVNGVELQKLIGHVKILQDSTLFYCDSAYYFESENRLEAYRNVRVEMPDSVTMVADRAIYNSETRIAEVYDNITLTDASVTLTTNRLTYDRNQSFGFYKNGGKLVDEDTELTSQLGYYYPDENMAYFRKKVVLTSPDYTLKTDTLAYDTESKIARFVTLTQIISEGGDIETTSGNYDTEARRVNLFARSQVKDSTYTLSADTLFYDDGMNLGYAIGRVVVDQTDTTLQIRGNYGEFNRETDESLVTNNPVAVQVFESDTLFLFADTLKSYIEQRIDTIRYRFLDNSILKKYLPPTDSSITDSLILDSIKVSNKLLAIRLQDSLGVDTSRVDTQKYRIFKGFYNVRFYMREMQGRCDSLVYFYDDSLLYLFQKPMLWSDENEIYGDTIKVWMKNGQADSMWLGQGAFLISEEDTVGYNQIKGKEMRASFREGKLSKLAVLGNSESIYFAKEEDSTSTTYQGMNQALSQSMNLYFEDNDLKKIVFLAQPEGSFRPMFEILDLPNRLEGMRWEPENRTERPDVEAIMSGLWPPYVEAELLPLEEGEVPEAILPGEEIDESDIDPQPLEITIPPDDK